MRNRKPTDDAPPGLTNGLADVLVPTGSIDVGAWAPFIQAGLNTDISHVIVVVENVAELKALTSAYDTAVFITMGYYSAVDSGGGRYIYDPDSVETADEFLIIAPDTLSGRFKLLHNGEASVEQAGAKGDGVTIDSNAITAAVQGCAANGITLSWSKKTYLVDKTIYPNGTFYWKCNRSTIKFDYLGKESNYHIMRRRDNAYETLPGPDSTTVILRVGIDLRNANDSIISGYLTVIGYNPGDFYLEKRNNVPNWLLGLAASTNNMDPTATNSILAATNGYGAESQFDHLYFIGLAAGPLYHQHSVGPATWAKGSGGSPEVYLLYQCVTHSGTTYQCLIAHSNTGNDFTVDLAANRWIAFAGGTGRVLPWTRTRFDFLEIQFCLIPFHSGLYGTSFDDMTINVLRITRCGGLKGTYNYGQALLSGTDLNIQSVFCYGLQAENDFETITCDTTAGSATVATSGDLSGLVVAGDTIVLGPAIPGTSINTVSAWPNRNFKQNTGCYFTSDVASITDDAITFKDVIPYEAADCKIYVNPLFLNLAGSCIVTHWFSEALLNYIKVAGNFTCQDFKVSTGEYSSQYDSGIILPSGYGFCDVTLNSDAMRTYFLKRVVGIVSMRTDTEAPGGVGQWDSVCAVTVRVGEHLSPTYTEYVYDPNIRPIWDYVNTGIIDYSSLSAWIYTGHSYSAGTHVEYANIEWECAAPHVTSDTRNFWMDLASGYWTKVGVPFFYGYQGRLSNRALWAEYIDAENHINPGTDRSRYVLDPGSNIKMICGDGTYYLNNYFGQRIGWAERPLGPSGNLSISRGRIYSSYDSVNLVGGASPSTVMSAEELASWKAAIFFVRHTGTGGALNGHQVAVVNIGGLTGGLAVEIGISNLVSVTDNFEFTSSGGILQIKFNGTGNRTAIINGLRIY